VVRIGLLGGECTGKSTLAAALATQLPGTALIVPEYVREFVRREARAPRKDEQAAVLAEQVARENLLAQESPEWLIADPAAAMTAVYSQIYFDDESLVAAACEHLQTYDVVLWCDLDLPWVADPGQRDGPHMRVAAHRAITNLCAQVNTHLLSGPLDERVTKARAILLPGV
jgi:nicotinamide riboside kinase